MDYKVQHQIGKLVTLTTTLEKIKDDKFRMHIDELRCYINNIVENMRNKSYDIADLCIKLFTIKEIHKKFVDDELIQNSFWIEYIKELAPFRMSLMTDYINKDKYLFKKICDSNLFSCVVITEQNGQQTRAISDKMSNEILCDQFKKNGKETHIKEIDMFDITTVFDTTDADVKNERMLFNCTKKSMRNKIKKEKKKALHKQLVEKNIVNFLTEKCVEKKWYKNCIPINIILHEMLTKRNINSKIKKGFVLLNNNSSKYALWHIWTETDNEVYDIATNLTNVLHNNDFYNIFETKLVEEVPDGYERIDMDNEDELKILNQNKKMYQKYISDPSKFWEGHIGGVTVSEIEMFEQTRQFRNEMLQVADKL